VSTMINRLLKKKDEQMQLVRCIYDIRQDHPTMGVRDIYYKMLPNCMGRDAFERFCKEQNLMSKSPKNYRRTTDSSGVIRFDNLIENIVSTAINQVWQSDISYFEVGGKFYYLTFILDAFSRRIIGHATSERLFTEQTTLPALDMAIRNRKINNPLRGLIFHSDGGGQYYDKEFLKVTQKHGIQNSMCEFAWENGKAERINGIIKNNYLKHRNINSYEQLVKEVDRSVSLYNHDKPHIKLKRLSPIAFENKILHLSSSFKESRSINKYNYAEHS
jgi:putative transposase